MNYLLYAVKVHQGILTCPSTQIDQIYIPRGISRQNIPASCHHYMGLTNVHSQFNLKLEANVKYKPWTPDSRTLESTSPPLPMRTCLHLGSGTSAMKSE